MSLKDTLNLIKGANPLKPNMLGCWKQQQGKGEFVILGFLKTRKTNQNQKKSWPTFPSLFLCGCLHTSLFLATFATHSQCVFFYNRHSQRPTAPWVITADVCMPELLLVIDLSRRIS